MARLQNASGSGRLAMGIAALALSLFLAVGQPVRALPPMGGGIDFDGTAELVWQILGDETVPNGLYSDFGVVHLERGCSYADPCGGTLVVYGALGDAICEIDEEDGTFGMYLGTMFRCDSVDVQVTRVAPGICEVEFHIDGEKDREQFWKRLHLNGWAKGTCD